MRRLLAFLPLIVGLCSSPALAAAPIRLVESFSTPGFDRGQVLKVTALTPAQKSDPNYNVMASLLGDALSAAGLNIQQDATAPDDYVLLDYKAFPIPFFRQFQAPVNDPSYRALVVTAIDAHAWDAGRRLKILWQVAVDQTGISSNPNTTIPPLVAAAAHYYGRDLTPRGLNAAARCGASGLSTTGTHISGACNSILTPLGAGVGFAAFGGGGAGSGVSR